MPTPVDEKPDVGTETPPSTLDPLPPSLPPLLSLPPEPPDSPLVNKTDEDNKSPKDDPMDDELKEEDFEGDFPFEFTLPNTESFYVVDLAGAEEKLQDQINEAPSEQQEQPKETQQEKSEKPETATTYPKELRTLMEYVTKIKGGLYKVDLRVPPHEKRKFKLTYSQSNLMKANMRMVTNDHICFVTDFNKEFPWSSISLDNHLATLYYLISNPSMVALLSGEFEDDRRRRGDDIPFSTRAVENLGNMVRKLTMKNTMTIVKEEEVTPFFKPTLNETSVEEAKNSALCRLPFLLEGIAKTSRFTHEEKIRIIEGMCSFFENYSLLQQFFSDNIPFSYNPDETFRGPLISTKMRSLFTRRRLVDIKHRIEKIETSRRNGLTPQETESFEKQIMNSTSKERIEQQSKEEHFRILIEAILVRIRIQDNYEALDEITKIIFPFLDELIPKAKKEIKYPAREQLQEAMDDYFKQLPHLNQTSQYHSNQTLHFLLSNPFIISLLAGAHDPQVTNSLPLATPVIKLLGVLLCQYQFSEILRYGGMSPEMEMEAYFEEGSYVLLADYPTGKEALNILDMDAQREREKKIEHYLQRVMASLQKQDMEERVKMTNIIKSFLYFLMQEKEKQQLQWDLPHSSPFVTYVLNITEKYKRKEISIEDLLSQGVRPDPEGSPPLDPESNTDTDSDSDDSSMPPLSSRPSMENLVAAHQNSTSILPHAYPTSQEYEQLKQDISNNIPIIDPPLKEHYDETGKRKELFGPYQPETKILPLCPKPKGMPGSPMTTLEILEICTGGYSSFFTPPWPQHGPCPPSSDLHRDLARYMSISYCLSSFPPCTDICLIRNPAGKDSYKLLLRNYCVKGGNRAHLPSPSIGSTQKEKDIIFYKDMCLLLDAYSVIMYPPHSKHYDEKGDRKTEHGPYRAQMLINYRNDSCRPDQLMAKGFISQCLPQDKATQLEKDINVYHQEVRRTCNIISISSPENSLYNEDGNYHHWSVSYTPQMIETPRFSNTPRQPLHPVPLKPRISIPQALEELSTQPKLQWEDAWVLTPHPNQSMMEGVDARKNFNRPCLQVRGDATLIEKQWALYHTTEVDLSIFGVVLIPPLKTHYDENGKRNSKFGLYAPEICINYLCQTTRPEWVNRKDIKTSDSDMDSDYNLYLRDLEMLEYSGVTVLTPPGPLVKRNNTLVAIQKEKPDPGYQPTLKIKSKPFSSMTTSETIRNNTQLSLQLHGSYVVPPLRKHYCSKTGKRLTKTTHESPSDYTGSRTSLPPYEPRIAINIFQITSQTMGETFFTNLDGINIEGSDLEKDFYEKYLPKVEDFLTFGCQGVLPTNGVVSNQQSLEIKPFLRFIDVPGSKERIGVFPIHPPYPLLLPGLARRTLENENKEDDEKIKSIQLEALRLARCIQTREPPGFTQKYGYGPGYRHHNRPWPRRSFGFYNRNGPSRHRLSNCQYGDASTGNRQHPGEKSLLLQTSHPNRAQQSFFVSEGQEPPSVKRLSSKIINEEPECHPDLERVEEIMKKYEDAKADLSIFGALVIPPLLDNYDEEGNRKPEAEPYIPHIRINYKGEDAFSMHNQHIYTLPLFEDLQGNILHPLINMKEDRISQAEKDIGKYTQQITNLNYLGCEVIPPPGLEVVNGVIFPPQDLKNWIDDQGRVLFDIEIRSPILLDWDTRVPITACLRKRIYTSHPNQVIKTRTSLTEEAEEPHPSERICGSINQRTYNQAKIDLSIYGSFIRPPNKDHYNEHGERKLTEGLYHPHIEINYGSLQASHFKNTLSHWAHEGHRFNKRMVCEFRKDIMKYREAVEDFVYLGSQPTPCLDLDADINGHIQCEKDPSYVYKKSLQLKPLIFIKISAYATPLLFEGRFERFKHQPFQSRYWAGIERQQTGHSHLRKGPEQQGYLPEPSFRPPRKNNSWLYQLKWNTNISSPHVTLREDLPLVHHPSDIEDMNNFFSNNHFQIEEQNNEESDSEIEIIGEPTTQQTISRNNPLAQALIAPWGRVRESLSASPTRPVFSGSPGPVLASLLQENHLPQEARENSRNEDDSDSTFSENSDRNETDLSRDTHWVKQVNKDFKAYGPYVLPPDKLNYNGDKWRSFGWRYIPTVESMDRFRAQNHVKMPKIRSEISQDPRETSMDHFDEDTILGRQFMEELRLFDCFAENPKRDQYNEQGERNEEMFFLKRHLRIQIKGNLTTEEYERALSATPFQSDFHVDNVCRIKELARLSNPQVAITMIPPVKDNYNEKGERIVKFHDDYEPIPVLKNDQDEFPKEKYILSVDQLTQYPDMKTTQIYIDFVTYISTIKKTATNYFSNIQLPNPRFYTDGKRNRTTNDVYIPRVILYQDPCFDCIERPETRGNKFIIPLSGLTDKRTTFQKDLQTFIDINTLRKKHQLLVIPPHRDLYHKGARLTSFYGSYKPAFTIDFTSLGHQKQGEGGYRTFIKPSDGKHSDIRNDIQLYLDAQAKLDNQESLTILPPNLDHYDSQGERLRNHGRYLQNGLQLMKEPPIINHLLFKGQTNTGLLDPPPPANAPGKETETTSKELLTPQLSSHNQGDNRNHIVIPIRDCLLAFVWFLTVLLFLLFFRK